MSDQNDQLASLERAALADLMQLADGNHYKGRKGLTAATLVISPGLTRFILYTLGVESLFASCDHITVLKKVILPFVGNLRNDAKGCIELEIDPANSPLFQSCAAAELLNLTDENALLEVQDRLAGGVEWRTGQRMGPRKSRAAVWLGGRDPKTVGNRREECLREFLSHLLLYIRDLDSHSVVAELVRSPLNLLPSEPLHSTSQAAASVQGNRISRSKQRPATIEDPPLYPVVRDFAANLRKQLVKDQKENKVDLPDDLSVKWDVLEGSGFVDGWKRIRKHFGSSESGNHLQLPNTIVELAELIQSSPTGRLVILGRGGAGKTTLAAELALALLDPVRRIEDQPVPFIFNVSSWNPEEEHLEDWMVNQLKTGRRLLQKRVKNRRSLAAAQLVEGNHILPILDGFDEMGEPLLAAAIRAIDDWLTRSQKLILLSRPEEYYGAVSASRALPGAAVLMLQDLELIEVQEYLSTTNREDDWEAVFSYIMENREAAQSRVLQTVFTTPLMAMLAGVIYSRDYEPDKRRDPLELLDVKQFCSVDAITSHLLDAFVKARFENSPQPRGSKRPRSWQYNDARKWLGFLATALVVDRTTDFAWWKTDGWLRYVPIRFKFPLSLLGLVALVRLVANIVTGDSTQEVVSDWSMVIILALGMIYLSVFIGKESEPRVFAWGLQPHAPFLSTISSGQIYITFVGVVFPLAGAEILSRGHGVLVFIVSVLLLAVPLFSSAAVSTDMRSPWQLLQDDQRAGLLRWGLYGGVFAGIFLTLLLMNGDWSTIYDVVSWSVVVAAFVLLPSPSSTWLLRQSSLALSGKLPWRCMSFLRYAHSRGVLRQSGGVYQFRHILLQNQLAEWYVKERVGQLGNINPTYLQSMLVMSRFKAGNYEIAEGGLRKILESYEKSGDRIGVATTTFLLVEVLRTEGRIWEAIGEVQALRVSKADAKVYRQFESHQILVELLMTAGKFKEARIEYLKLRERLTGAERLFATIFEVEAARKTLVDIEENRIFKNLRALTKFYLPSYLDA